MEPNKFNYVDSQGNQHEVNLTKDDFQLVQKDVVISDQKIQSKPTTFFKDALRRFRKNKSSVAGAVILGSLVVLAIVLPFALPSDIDTEHPDEYLLAPKLFDAGAGWWDGGKEYKNVVVNVDWAQYDKDGTVVAKPANHSMDLVIGGESGITTGPIEYVDSVNAYAHGGYARLNGTYRAVQAESQLVTAADGTSTLKFNKDKTYVFTAGEEATESGTWSYTGGKLELKDPADNTISAEGNSLAFTYVLSSDNTVTADFTIASSIINSMMPVVPPQLMSWDGATFDFTDQSHNYAITVETVNPLADPELKEAWKYGAEVSYDLLLEWTDNNQNPRSYLLADDVTTFGAKTINLNDHFDGIREEIDKDPYAQFVSGYVLKPLSKPHLTLRLNMEDKGETTNNVVIKTIRFTSAVEADKENFDGMSLINANESLRITPFDKDNNPQKYYWTTLNGTASLFHAKIVRGTYRIDTYKQHFGERYVSPSIETLRSWANNGWISADFTIADQLKDLSGDELAVAAQKFADSIKVLDQTYSPIIIDDEHRPVGTKTEAGGIKTINITVYATYWKVLYPGRSSCPRYLFGTDKYGKDLLHQVFAGLRTSLILGILTTAVNLTIGLIYGAFAGYFGGWTDILMERFTDILGGMPWIVVMTLCIINMGNSFWVFGIALCLTGWIGTSATTRTQFYRFKNREYILAARTLGASDGRLIFRHILPNAVGTIVTSSVLMIPGVIFSEATLAYLSLGLQGVASFGVILAENQDQMQTNPHLILFPSVIMALIMISFNLFGNGLRDAFNPSLKGGE